MCLLHLPTLLSLLAFTSSLPTFNIPAKPLPLLIWHGLGDRYDADGLHSTGDLAKEVHPGTFVYYIRTDDDGSNDRTNTFFGNVTTQIAQVCEDLRKDPSTPGRGWQELACRCAGFQPGRTVFSGAWWSGARA